MTAKEYLRQIHVLDLKIEQKIEEKKELLHRAAGVSAVTSDPNKVQTSGNTVGPMRYVDRAMDLEKNINRLIEEYTATRDKIINQIHEMEDPRYIELLSLRYVGRREKNGRIHYLRLEEIACTMTKSNGEPYSYDHINRLHGEALQKFCKQHGIADL